MPTVTLYNQAGNTVGELELNNTVFGIEPNEQAVYDVVKAQRAAMRQGTASTKNRSAVRGGGRKPWRQKGTGRARAGSNTSPIWVGGGITFGPTPRQYKLKVNKKVRRLALKSVLSSRVADKKFLVLDKLELNDIKTKDFVAVLESLKLEGKVVVVLDQANETVMLSARNLPNVTVTTVSQASVYELMNFPTIVATADAVKQYEEVLG